MEKQSIRQLRRQAGLDPFGGIRPPKLNIHNKININYKKFKKYNHKHYKINNIPITTYAFKDYKKSKKTPLGIFNTDKYIIEQAHIKVNGIMDISPFTKLLSPLPLLTGNYVEKKNQAAHIAAKLLHEKIKYD